MRGNTVCGYDGKISGGLSSLDDLYIPVNFHDNHWLFIRVNFLSKEIELWDYMGTDEHYDSLPTATQKYLYYALHKGLADGAPPYDLWHVDWMATNRSSESPRQRNDMDCGIFMLTFMALLRSGATLEPHSYSQEMLSSA